MRKSSAPTLELLPLHPNIGFLNAVMRSTSDDRADRIGPTVCGMFDWNTAMNRVMPSTSSSMTMSAWLSPTCGLAVPGQSGPSELSILRMSAGRLAAASSATGTPVSGPGGPGATVVVVVDSVVDVDVEELDDDVVAALSLLSPQADATTANEISSPMTARDDQLRMCCSELP